MTLESSYIASSSNDLYQTTLSETTGDVIAVNPSEKQIEALVTVVDQFQESPTVRILAHESSAKWLRNDFVLASTTADTIAAGNLSLRTANSLLRNRLMVTSEAVATIVSAGDQIARLVTTDNDFVKSAREKWSEEWDSAAEFSLRTPPRSAVHESLAAEIGEEVDADFRAMLDSVDSTRGEEALNVVQISLLAAAKNEIQLFEISTWGEDSGVASRATFSRMKTQFEEGGVITTEKIPIDVGRPRLRLLLADELRGIDAGDLVEQARKVIFAAPA
jgi:hypothetical protein